MHLPSDFTVRTLAPGEPVVMSHHTFVAQLKPVELLILPKGAKDDTPSFTWVLEDGEGGVYAAQITNTMLIEGLKRAEVILNDKNN